MTYNTSVEEKLLQIIKKFPGVGQRQASRIVYFLRTLQNDEFNTFVSTLKNIKENTSYCGECFCLISNNSATCDFCGKNKDHTKLLIVEKDIDKDVMVSSHYSGDVFILGSLFSVIKNTILNPERLVSLKDKVLKNHYEEIILAFSDTKEGQFTTDRLEDELKKYSYKGKISVLGRGISTGAEIEYLDPKTIESALSNRK